MSKQKIPNIYPSTTNEFGVLKGSRLNEAGNYETQFVAPNSNGFCGKYKVERGLTSVVTISSAELLALFTTPIEVIPAPGAGYTIVPKRVVISHGTGTAYSGIASGEDLVLKYTDASGAECSQVIETTGFLDQATAQIRTAGAVITSLTPVENAAVVLHLLSGNITTGNYPIQVLVDYDIIPTDFVGA